MARRIELKTGCVLEAANGATFGWGELMLGVLRWGRPGEGLVLDQVIRCVEAARPIKEAIAAEAETVTLTEEQWQTLRERLAVYSFPGADEAFAEFGLAVRGAEEIT